VSLAFLVSGQAQQALSFFGFSGKGHASPTHSFLAACAGSGAGADEEPPIFNF
jgi:hypothetical protein